MKLKIIPALICVINGNGFNLTGASDGVYFDINGDGVTEHISWTRGGRRVAHTRPHGHNR
jgi:hypothetical protein